MKLRAIVAVIVLTASLILSVSACDNRPCVRGHYDYMPMLVGKTTTIMPVWVCDVYGKATK